MLALAQTWERIPTLLTRAARAKPRVRKKARSTRFANQEDSPQDDKNSLYQSGRKK